MMENFVGMSIPVNDSRPLRARRIDTGVEDGDVTYRITQPLSCDIREVPVGESIDWAAVYR